MTAERRIRTLERSDGKARLFIIERDDGLYRFQGEREIIGDEWEGMHWDACDHSGLYGSADEAEQTAHRDVLWLRDEISN